jgi:protein-tyrosine phosphatase
VQAPVPPTSRIEGVNYEVVKVSGRSLERFFVSQLSWLGFFQFIILYVLGYRIPAVTILSREVLLPRGLVGLARDTLDWSGSEINKALSLYTIPEALPSIVHCTQGKDRTGLICALVLGILGVPIPAIEHDYFLTDSALDAGKEERLAEIRAIGLTEDWGVTATDMITAIYEHIDQAYGSLDNYLDGIGFDHDKRRKVREMLLY